MMASCGPHRASTEPGIAGHAASVAFSGDAASYTLTASGGGLTVAGASGTVQISDVTAITFADTTDIVAQAPGTGTVTTGNVTELYGAVFGRIPDVPGMAFYQAALAANPATPLITFAQYFLASPEYTQNPAHAYAQTTGGDAQFITDSYTNLLGRAPEAGAVSYYQNVITQFTQGLPPGTDAYTHAEFLAHATVLTYFSQSPEFLGDVTVTAQHPSSAQHWLVLI